MLPIGSFQLPAEEHRQNFCSAPGICSQGQSFGFKTLFRSNEVVERALHQEVPRIFPGLSLAPDAAVFQPRVKGTHSDQEIREIKSPSSQPHQT